MEILQAGIGEIIQPYDLDEFREWNRTKKAHTMIDKVMTEAEAVWTAC